MKALFNANQIKILAILAMTVDHIAWVLFPGYQTGILPILMHIIGRITCPIMCYFIAEGYHYTKDVGKYTRRLFIFAVVSHFAYGFFSADHVNLSSFVPFYNGEILNQTSVMWSLAWGLVMLRIADSKQLKETIKPFLIILLCLVTLPGDWSCIASLWILAFGTNRGDFKKQMLWMVFYAALYSVVYFFALDKIYGILQLAVVLSIPLLMLYNGRRGHNRIANKAMKWLFYIYYPLHLCVLGLIQFLRA